MLGRESGGLLRDRGGRGKGRPRGRWMGCVKDDTRTAGVTGGCAGQRQDGGGRSGPATPEMGIKPVAQEDVLTLVLPQQNF